MDLQSNTLTITKVQNGAQGDPGTPGTPGTNGYNAATIYIYQRVATQPTAPSNNLTYTFNTGALTPTSSLGNWSQTMPANGTNPCWIGIASAISNTSNDTIETSDWVIRELVENGQDGEPGTDGYNQATIYLYQRTSDQSVSAPTGYTYTFSTDTISPTLTTWSRAIPSGTDPCWVTSAVVVSRIDSNNALTFVTPTIMVQNGENGQDGSNGNNYIKLDYYQRADRAPSALTGTYSYNFSTQQLSPSISASTGWQTTIPNGNDPCWVTSIVFYGNDTTETSTFTVPVKLVQNGADGENANQYIIRTITEEILKFVDQRSTSNNKTYEFSINNFQMFGFNTKTQTPINNIEYSLVSITAEDFIGYETQYYKYVNNEYVQCQSGEGFNSNINYYQQNILYDILDIEIQNNEKAYKFKEIFNLNAYSRYVYKQGSDYINYYFSISTLYNDLLDGTLNSNSFTNEFQSSAQEIINIFINYFNDKNGFDFRVYGQVFDLDNNEFNIEKFISVKNGLAEEMLDFSINAGSINAAIQNKKLTFNAEGLTITNNGLTIEIGEEGEDKETVFYIDPLSKQLVMNGSGTFTGTIYATDGVFEGNINASTGSIGGFNINKTNISSKSQNLQLYSQLDIDTGIIEQGDIDGTGSIISSDTSIRTQGYISVQSGHTYVIQDLIAHYIEATELDENTFNMNKENYYLYNDGIYIQCTNSSIFDENKTYYTHDATQIDPLTIVEYQKQTQNDVDIYTYITSTEGEPPYTFTAGENTNCVKLVFKKNDNSLITPIDLESLEFFEDVSLIKVENINIGDGGVIDGYLKVGNLTFISPDKEYINDSNELVVMELKVPGQTAIEDEVYFQLTNEGYINGNNWSIKKEAGNPYVVARFGKLIAEDGEFNGVIRARDGVFTGEVISSVISASTINTVNFVTEKTRSMGGSFIFKPTFEIYSIEDKSNNNIEFTLSENSNDYFSIEDDINLSNELFEQGGIIVDSPGSNGELFDSPTEIRTKDFIEVNSNEKFQTQIITNKTISQRGFIFYNQSKNFMSYSTDTTVTIPEGSKYIKIIITVDENENDISPSDIEIFTLKRVSDKIVAISGFDTRFGKITNINENKIQVYLENADYNVLKAEDALENYKTLTLFGSAYYDTLIGINSDDANAGDILAPKALSMETFTTIQSSEVGVGNIDYNLNLLLGDLSTLKLKDSSFNYIDGYGLYADNVFLHGSLMTRNGEGAFAGVHTSKNLDFDYTKWGGIGTNNYSNEKIIFWGGSNDLSDDSIQRSPFIVTDKGGIFANRGEFKGTVITDSTIANSVIKTPVLYGAGSNPSLKIYNTYSSSGSGGISFYKTTNETIGDSDDKQTLNISDLGFIHYNEEKGTKFIEFTDNSNNIYFYGTSMTTGSTVYKEKTIEDENTNITIDGSNNIVLDYNNTNKIIINDIGIINSGGNVINEETTTFKGTGDNSSKQLKYTINNYNYYCLFVS